MSDHSQLRHEAERLTDRTFRMRISAEVVLALLDEIDQLTRWKVEALLVLGQWDAVHEAAGSPAQCGATVEILAFEETQP